MLEPIAKGQELLAKGEMTPDAWWVKYYELEEDIEAIINDGYCDTDQKLKALNLMKAHLELSAKVNGMLKLNDGNITIDKMIVAITAEATEVLRKLTG